MKVKDAIKELLELDPELEMFTFDGQSEDTNHVKQLRAEVLGDGFHYASGVLADMDKGARVCVALIGSGL